MKIEQKLYTRDEAKTLIVAIVDDLILVINTASTVSSEELTTKLKQWADEMYPQVCALVAEEVVRRHVQGVTFSVWSGPPGSGKGTNMQATELIGKIYAEVVSQGGEARLPEPYHTKILALSLEQGLISTGTKGMFNLPEGEYKELFGALVPIISGNVGKGGFVSDSMVSVLVCSMILYRLTEDFHKIQMDLWPRTVQQLQDYYVLVKTIREKGGKVFEELVNLKVVPIDQIEKITSAPDIAAQRSQDIAQLIKDSVSSDWYKNAVTSVSGNDAQSRFKSELTVLEQLFTRLKEAYTDEVARILIGELETICDRMAFRFNKELEKGETPREDEYPLHVIKRLIVYTSETAPAFLRALTMASADNTVIIASAFDTPDVVIDSILEKIVQSGSEGSESWKALKKIAGELANKIVHREDVIVDTYIKAVGGILRT